MKKNIFVLPLLMITVFSLISCGENLNTSSTSSASIEPIFNPVLDKYDLETYMKPLWEGEEVYHESVMFIGKDDKAPLVYTPSEIISVRSPDLKTEYQEGIDYRVEDGKIALVEGSSIPFMTLEEYYPKSGNVYTDCVPSSLGEERPYIRFGEGDTFSKYQVAVSYKHDSTYSGFTPKSYSKYYSKTRKKLEDGENVNIVFFGDSITEGYNTSSFVNVEPYADRWSEMVSKKLAATYKNATVNCINTGVAGKDSTWAAQELKNRVIDKNPDLAVIAFGMNDVNANPETLATKLSNLAKQVMYGCSGCEVLLVATMLPNKEASSMWTGNQSLFEDAMINSVTSQNLPVGVVQMGSLHASLLEKKPYYHMTGNNINHPNDFLARMYAQSIIKAILN